MGAYKFETLDQIRKNYKSSEIKKMMTKKIDEFEKHGFYLDINKDSDISFVKCFEEEIRKNISDLPENFDFSEYYQTIGTYEFINGKHEFIHVSPKDFTFEYVSFDPDLGSLSPLNISSSVTYMNSFWGIYIKNDILKIHALVQYDFFVKYYAIAPYNLYDGGNDLLGYSSNRYTHKFSLSEQKQSGGVFSSWEDFIQTNERLYAYNEKKRLDIIKDDEAKFKSQIKDAKKEAKQYATESKKRMNMLKKVSF